VTPDVATANVNERPTAVDAQAAFSADVERELDRAYRLAGLILGGASDAEDVVQDAVLVAWRSYRSLHDPDKFRAWFDRIVVNICRDRLRRRRIVRFVPIDGDAAARNDPFAAVLARDAVLRHLDVLGPDERPIVVLHYWADLALEDVALRLEIPVGTVKSRLHRALERMRAAAAAAEEVR
jgi:RNA polymerase sigma-70 factor (ECF subfamily)